jgi:hypothetical protein
VDAVGALEVVGNLCGTESEESELDDAGDEREPVLLVPRVGAFGLDPLSATGTVVAGDLDVEDERLERRKVWDRPSANLERFPQARAAVRAPLEGELEGSRVRNGALASSPRVAALATGGEWILVDGAPIEHSARGDAAGLGGPVGGREHRTAGLAPSELLLESPVLLA